MGAVGQHRPRLSHSQKGRPDRFGPELGPTWTYGFLNAVALGDLTHLDVGFRSLPMPPHTG